MMVSAIERYKILKIACIVPVSRTSLWNSKPLAFHYSGSDAVSTFVEIMK